DDASASETSATQYPLDRDRESIAEGATPASDVHQGPVGCGTSPTVIVAATRERPVVFLRGAENLRALWSPELHPVRRAVGNLDGANARRARALRRGQAVEHV